MSRRVLGTAALATAILATGIVPLLGSASAAGCPSWTDSPGDATTNKMPVSVLADDQMDIVAASLSTVGATVVAKITVTDLVDQFSDIGDRFTVQFDLPGAKLRFYADRDVTGDYAGLQNITGTTEGAATAVWDITKNTITMTATQAEIDKAAGRATKGESAVVVAATSGVQGNGDDLYGYDSANTPVGTTYKIGEACGGTPDPTTSPTPTTPPGSVPDGYPKAGCDTATDGKGDGGVDGPISNASGPVVQGPNDVDLDLTGLAIGTTATEVVAFLRIDDLKAAPSNGNGHQFDVTFTHNAKAINIYTQQVDAVVKAQRDALGDLLIPPTGGKVGTAYDERLKVTSAFDITNNVVQLRLDRASLDLVAAKPAPDGTVVTAVVGASRMITPTGGYQTADYVQAATATAQVYTFGVSPCFGPPPGVLRNTGKTSVQYTDAAAVAAKLTNADGDALAGKTVRFAIGSKAVNARTGSDGVARASLNPGVVAGTYSLVTSFAGDSSADVVSLTTPFKVVTEKTRIVLTVAKSGTRRTVTAKLLDDDGRPVAGQTIAWYVNGRKVSSARTTSSGIATFKTAKPTQTVKAVFSAVTGKFVGSTAQKKV